MPVVYLDNAATTAPEPELLAESARLARECYGNPSSAHRLGAAASRLLEEARHRLAAALGAGRPNEITFTSGGTEANALAVAGAAQRARGRHVIVGALEHPAVLRNVERLAEAQGFDLSVVPPDGGGQIPAAAVRQVLRPDTALVAVMLVNNEVGTLQPLGEIAAVLAEHARAIKAPRPPHFHVDAVQGLGWIPFRVATLGADSVAVSAHKVHGPKGVGALWLRPGARVAPLWQGGGQEQGLRSGTENLVGAAAFASAATLATAARADRTLDRVRTLRDTLERRVLAEVPGARLTIQGPTVRAPHISSIAFDGLAAEPLLHAMEARDVMVSAGSACASKTRGPSHVLRALGVGDDTAVLRFSLSRHSTDTDIAAAVDALAQAVVELAAVSPIPK